MEYSDIQIIEDKIVKVVYDTLELTKGPKGIPQNVLQKHNRKGYTNGNPALTQLYKSRLDKLIIDYVKTVILYVFHNDITDLTHISNNYPQKFIDIEQFEYNEAYKYKFSDMHYWREEKVPLVYVDFNKNLIDIPWIGKSAVGTKFEYDFVRKADYILPRVYNELKDDDELMCWLMLSGLASLFSDQLRSKYE